MAVFQLQLAHALIFCFETFVQGSEGSTDYDGAHELSGQPQQTLGSTGNATPAFHSSLACQ
jgi:hypothetical protein